MVVHTFNPRDRGRQISEFQVSLDCILSSRLVRVTYFETVSKEEKTGGKEDGKNAVVTKSSLKKKLLENSFEKLRKFGDQELPNTVKEGDQN